MKTINLHTDSVPCSAPISRHAIETLTLIHGWGADNGVWLDWASTELAPHFNIVLIELPGFGQSPHFEALEQTEIAEAWLMSLLKALPEKTHLLGWSLGGLLAQKLALQYPDRIQSLVCLASTPRFVQNDGWRWAVNPPLLADFIKALGIEYGSVLKQFWRLQLQGSDNARPLMKKLSAHMSQRALPHYSGLLQGLYLLRDLDNRSQLPNLKQPTLWLLGEHDPLIPQDLIKDLLLLQPHAKIQVIKGAAHMPFFSHPEETAHAIINFINPQN